MNIEFANRICPNCWNPNYVVFLGDFSKTYKYKCMNCNHYFNDIDVDVPSAPVWKSECMNSKVDMVEVVRCKDCKHGEKCVEPHKDYWCNLYEGYKWSEWFCADGERRTDDA